VITGKDTAISFKLSLWQNKISFRLESLPISILF